MCREVNSGNMKHRNSFTSRAICWIKVTIIRMNSVKLRISLENFLSVFAPVWF